MKGLRRFIRSGCCDLTHKSRRWEVMLRNLRSLWVFAIGLALFLLIAYVALRWGPGPVRFRRG